MRFNQQLPSGLGLRRQPHRLVRAALVAALTSLAANPSFSKSATPLVSVSTPLLRFTNALSHLSISSQADYLAYLTPADQGPAIELRVMELASQRIYRVTDKRVGAGFTWDPFGSRLLYREIEASAAGLLSKLNAYDATLHKSVLVKALPTSSGYPTLNPRDLRLYTLAASGLVVTKLHYPSNRLAKWQSSARIASGNWLVTQQGVLWATFGGMEIERLKDDGSGVASYSISPDGELMAWASQSGQIYISSNGQGSIALGAGRDPHWHPSKRLLVYAGGRMVGKTTTGYDLRVVNEQGEGRWLTYTQHTHERWPQWHPRGASIFYTAERTTDLYSLDLQHDEEASARIAIKR